MKKIIPVLVLFCLVATATQGQIIAIKTNLLEYAALTPNLGVEVGVARRLSIDARVGYSDASFWQTQALYGRDKQLTNTTGSMELRYWLCGKFNGNFFGVHGLYSLYDARGMNIPLLFDKAYRYKGTAYGGGISWGYHWMWSKRWGLEFNLGAGVAMMTYDKYDIKTPLVSTGRFQKTYFGPTKAGVTLVFILN